MADSRRSDDRPTSASIAGGSARFLSSRFSGSWRRDPSSPFRSGEPASSRIAIHVASDGRPLRSPRRPGDVGGPGGSRPFEPAASRRFPFDGSGAASPNRSLSGLRSRHRSSIAPVGGRPGPSQPSASTTLFQHSASFARAASSVTSTPLPVKSTMTRAMTSSSPGAAYEVVPQGEENNNGPLPTHDRNRLFSYGFSLLLRSCQGAPARIRRW